MAIELHIPSPAGSFSKATAMLTMLANLAADRHNPGAQRAATSYAAPQ